MKVIKPNLLSPVDGSFSRASAGTYWNASGVLSIAGNNAPRINYNPATKEFEGVMLEQAATNLVFNSEDLTNASWVKTNVSISSNSASAPDGTTNADKIIGTAGSTSRSIKSNSASLTDTFCTASGFFKAGEFSRVKLLIDNTVNQVGAIFDLTLGKLVSVDPDVADFINLSAAIESVGSGWFRCSLTAYKQSVNSNVSVVCKYLDSLNNEPLGNGSTGLLMWAMQLETGQKSTSYIKTTTSAATRAADVVTGSGLVYTDLTDPTPLYSSVTTYALGAKVRFNNTIWESLQASNTNHSPDASPTWWLSLGSDNIHAAFDNIVGTESKATGSMTLILKPGVIDSISMINLQAAVTKIAVTDPVEGTVYSQTLGMSGASVYDWYQYFFYDPLLKRTQIAITDIPQYVNALVTIQIEGDIAELVSVAQIILGVSYYFGGTSYGATSGLIDYSTKETDEFGNITFVKRAFSKRLSAQVYVDNYNLNRVQTFLYSIRATPVVWIGAEDPLLEEALIIFGFYREFSVDIAYPSFAMCSLDIEGLT